MGFNSHKVFIYRLLSKFNGSTARSSSSHRKGRKIKRELGTDLRAQGVDRKTSKGVALRSDREQ